MKRTCAAVVCALVASGSLADEKRRVPLYTNQDLERVRELRGETGGSTPAPEAETSAPARPAASGKPDVAAREAHWRKEAERHRDRVERLRSDVADVERRLAERRRLPGNRLLGDPTLDHYRARLLALAERIRDEETRFLDRARREGALPGWIR